MTNTDNPKTNSSVSTKISRSDIQLTIMSKEEYMNNLLMNGQARVINFKNMSSKPLNLEDLGA